MGNLPSASRQAPMRRIFQSEPAGSTICGNWRRRLAHAVSIRSRSEPVSITPSSSSGGTRPAAGGGLPSRFSSTTLPRLTGEVRVGWT